MPEYVVTLQWLCNSGACYEQVKLFKQTYGESVTLTPEVVRNAVDKFDLYWFALMYLNDRLWHNYLRGLKYKVGADREAIRAEALITALWPEHVKESAQ